MKSTNQSGGSTPKYDVPKFEIPKLSKSQKAMTYLGSKFVPNYTQKLATRAKLANAGLNVQSRKYNATVHNNSKRKNATQAFALMKKFGQQSAAAKARLGYLGLNSQNKINALASKPRGTSAFGAVASSVGRTMKKGLGAVATGVRYLEGGKSALN